MDTAETTAARRRVGAFAATGGDEWRSGAAPTTTEAEQADRSALRVPGQWRTGSTSHPEGRAAGFPGGNPLDVILAVAKVTPCHTVIGVNGSPEMIARTRADVMETRVCEWVSFMVAELTDTGLPTGYADVLVSNYVINLCPGEPAVYTEVHRLSRPGGPLAICEMMLAAGQPDSPVSSLRITWSGCLGGIITRTAYFDTLYRGGFLLNELEATVVKVLRLWMPVTQLKALLDVGDRRWHQGCPPPIQEAPDPQIP